MVRRVLHLRQHKSSKSTPLVSYFHDNKRVAIKAKDITDVLRLATVATGHQTGVNTDDISTLSLRSGGAMALRKGKIDHNTIRMLGRWHSDAMMRYLHLQSKPIMREFVATMNNRGAYTFLPDETPPLGDY
jgi:hypothetical protein